MKETNMANAKTVDLTYGERVIIGKAVKQLKEEYKDKIKDKKTILIKSGYESQVETCDSILKKIMPKFIT